MALIKKNADPKVEPEASPVEVEEAPVEKAVKKGKSEVRRFVGKKFSYYHPFQNKAIPLGGDGVVLELDNWLECQIKAGYIVEV